MWAASFGRREGNPLLPKVRAYVRLEGEYTVRLWRQPGEWKRAANADDAMLLAELEAEELLLT